MPQGILFRMRRLLLLAALGSEFLILFVMTTNVMFYLQTKAYIYNGSSGVPIADVVLIPGAALAQPRKLAPIFIDRVEAAINVYESGKAAKILVSGDNSTLEHNEVDPARVYLLGRGIPDEDIFLDHAGFDTYSSLYRARDVFGVRSMIIATQSFHLPRAVFIARKLGMEAHGVRADTGPVLIGNYVREVFADEKALFNVLLGRAPKYLGDIIPITGDGRDYR